MKKVFFAILLYSLSTTSSLSQTDSLNALKYISYDGSNLWCLAGVSPHQRLIRWNPVTETYALFSTSNGLLFNDIGSIATDKNGKLCVRYQPLTTYLTIFNGSTWENHLLDSNIGNIGFDGQGVLWVGTSTKLYCKADSGWCDMSDQIGLSTGIGYLTVDGLGRLIIGEKSSAAISRFWRHESNGEWKIVLQHDNSIWPVYDIAGAPNGDIWMVDAPVVVGLDSIATVNYLCNGDSVWQQCHFHVYSQGAQPGYITFSEDGTPWLKIHYGFPASPQKTFYTSFSNYSANIYTSEETPEYITCPWVRDSSEIKWIAACDGLVRYDGVSYRTLLIPLTNVRENSKPESMLLKTFPNPFNPSITISFTVTQKSLIKLDIFSFEGKKVATLVEDTKEPGTYSVEWKPENLASGLYLCRIKTACFTETSKMLFIK
jgi:hypothetical protein